MPDSEYNRRLEDDLRGLAGGLVYYEDLYAEEDWQELLDEAQTFIEAYEAGEEPLTIAVLLAKVLVSYDAWVLAGRPGSDPHSKCDMCGSSGLTHDPKCPVGTQTSFF